MESFNVEAIIADGGTYPDILINVYSWQFPDTATYVKRLYTSSVKSIKISYQMFDSNKPQVGCFTSASADIVLDLSVIFNGETYTEDDVLEIIPKNARLDIYHETKTGSEIRSYIDYGCFFVDSRSINRSNNTLELTCYDEAIQLDELYLNAIPDGAEFPMSAKNVISSLSEYLDDIGLAGVGSTLNGVDLNTLMIGYLNDITIREVLGYIAGACGCNVLYDCGSIKFYPLKNNSQSVANFTSTTYKHTKELQGIDSVIVNAGTVTRSITDSEGKETMETVELVYKSGSTFNNTLIVDFPWATQDVADNLLSTIIGYQYKPFTATKSVVSSCTGMWNLGNKITVNGDNVQVFSIDITLNSILTQDLSAPYTESTESETTKHSSKQERDIRRVVADATHEIGSTFTVKQDRIEASVASNDLLIKGIIDEQKTASQDIIDLQGNFNNQNQKNAQEFEEIYKKVDATMTSSEINFAIQEAVGSGATRVDTKTGFTFDADGLKIENTKAPTKTLINENGMKVFEGDDEVVLTANNNGVDAKNLHATTYLIIGNLSRFEDHDGRTCCYWIGQ